jgi:23S rRNA (cytosine1962-C5)-methyltransferase
MVPSACMAHRKCVSEHYIVTSHGPVERQEPYFEDSLAASAVVNRRGAERWRRGHPWIYRSDISQRPSAEAGAVLVTDEAGAVVGRALWSPLSNISLRMLTRDDRAIDAHFWYERIGTAVQYRADLAPESNAYRLVHGEADGAPSLIVDRYGDALVAEFLSAGLERYRTEITDALVELAAPSGVLARNDVPIRRHEGLAQTVELLYGTVPQEVEVIEGSVRYLAAPWTGQKTGAFLDQRENRARAEDLSRGRGLDCFAYHGSFALHLAARAQEVIAVDSSAAALERARSNAALNGFSRILTREADVFDFLRAEESSGRRYDIIVVDPPAFAKRKDAVSQAVRGYKELNLRAMRLLVPGGHLCTFSCSFHVDVTLFREMLWSAAADSGRSIRWIEERGQALDHPAIVQIPETSYLKGAILQAI